MWQESETALRKKQEDALREKQEKEKILTGIDEINAMAEAQLEYNNIQDIIQPNKDTNDLKILTDLINKTNNLIQNFSNFLNEEEKKIKRN